MPGAALRCDALRGAELPGVALRGDALEKDVALRCGAARRGAERCAARSDVALRCGAARGHGRPSVRPARKQGNNVLYVRALTPVLDLVHNLLAQLAANRGVERLRHGTANPEHLTFFCAQPLDVDNRV